MMKQFIWIIVALFVGLVVGSLGPRAELEQVRKELAEKDDSSAKPRFDGLQQMLNLSERSDSSATRRSRRSQDIDQGETDSVGENVSLDERDVDQGDDSADPEEGIDVRQERLMDAVELWQTRAALARSSFISNAELNEDQAVRFDVLVEAMNLRMAKIIEDYTEVFKGGQELTPEVGLRMMHDLSEIMVVSYDELDNSMPEDWRDSGDKVFDLGDFIDPSIAAPMLDVPGAFDGRWRQR